MRLDTGTADRCNNDHGLSPDGRWLAISHTDPELRHSVISVLTSDGGTPKRVTPLGPFILARLVARRANAGILRQRNGEFDIYTIAEPGGDEKRLTTAAGLDDGPDYSPDGKHIYFNSERTGAMKIWRMNVDGTAQEQVTSERESRRLVPPSIPGREVAGLPIVRQERNRPPGRQGRLAADHALRRRHAPGAGNVVRRPGHDQRSVVVTRQQVRRVCELSDGAALISHLDDDATGLTWRSNGSSTG